MQIGELGERSGVAAKTIRYYESIGVLPCPERTANGYRRYRDDAIGRLAFISAAQASGFTLGEIRGIVALRERGEAPCQHVGRLIDDRATDIDRRIAELQRVREELRRLHVRAERLDSTDCRPDAICHIIHPAASSGTVASREEVRGEWLGTFDRGGAARGQVVVASVRMESRSASSIEPSTWRVSPSAPTTTIAG